MKLIFITREGYRLPGARIRCYNFAKELAKYGVETKILSFSDDLGAQDGENESYMSLADKIRFNWLAFKRLIKDKNSIFYIQRFNYHSFAPYLAHMFNKNRIILDLDDWEMREEPRYHLGFYPSSKAHYITSMIAKRSIFCIGASRFLERFLRNFNERVYYIPSGVDTEVFKSSLKTLDEKEIIFSWIGTFHRREYVDNIGFALECFSALRKAYDNIYLDIVGDGIYRESIIKMIYTYKDSKIRFKGWTAPDQIGDYLDTIHIGLLPVTSDTKFNLSKSPTKLFEYMAKAKAVIASDIGEAANIIKDGYNGLLAGNKEEFIEKMGILVDDLDLRRSLGLAARQTVEENYSLKVLGKQLYNMLLTVEKPSVCVIARERLPYVALAKEGSDRSNLKRSLSF